MTAISRGRVIPMSPRAEPPRHPEHLDQAIGGRAVSAKVVRSGEQGQRVLADAQAPGAARLTAFEAQVDRLRSEFREQLAAELAAEHTQQALELVALRARVVRQAQDDIVRLAQVLAERVLGAELSLQPERIVALARQVLSEAAGAERVTIHASPDAAETLRSQVALLPATNNAALTIVADASLGQGDLRIETDLGRIDARISTQLSNLASVLVESIRS